MSGIWNIFGGNTIGHRRQRTSQPRTSSRCQYLIQLVEWEEREKKKKITDARCSCQLIRCLGQSNQRGRLKMNTFCCSNGEIHHVLHQMFSNKREMILFTKEFFQSGPIDHVDSRRGNRVDQRVKEWRWEDRWRTRLSFVHQLWRHSIEIFRERTDRLGNDVFIARAQQLNRRIRGWGIVDEVEQMIDEGKIRCHHDRREIGRCHTIECITNVNNQIHRTRILILPRRKTNGKLRNRTDGDDHHLREREVL